MGFFMVDNRVIDELKFDDSYEFAVYMIIYRYSNRGQISFPSGEFMRKSLRCSSRKISGAIKSLEKKEYIQVFRTPGKSNRYRITLFGEASPSSPGKKTSSHEENYKEQYINNKYKKTSSSGEKKEGRGVLLKKIHKLISQSTGVNIFQVEMAFPGGGLSLEKLSFILERIECSDFLQGRQVKKPNLRHFTTPTQIDKILSSFYDNGGGKRSDPLPSYYREFPETGEVDYEPVD